MSNDLTITLDMGHCGDSCSDSPDTMKITLTAHMLHTIAVALGAIAAMGVGLAEIVLPFDAEIELFTGDEPYDASDEDASARGMFVPSSAWLQIQANTLAVEVWEEHDDDTLNGNVTLTDHPEVMDALRALRPDVVGAMLKRLAA